MKKLILFFVVVLIAGVPAFSQGCLPEGITFSSQSQINSFPANYPNCTVIEGSVYILGEDISNLQGLSAINTIEGDLIIGFYENYANPELTSLEGLESLTNLGGSLLLIYNVSLNSLHGLEGLTGIGDCFQITGNEFTNLSGLENLVSIGISLISENTDNLTSFSGLNSLSFIGGSLTIDNNYSLISLSGLNNLKSVVKDIKITSNHALTSLAGLESVKASSVDNLSINNNSSLSNCAVQSVCDYLSSPGGVVDIYSNADGCNSPPEIANNCQIDLPCLPYGNYYFTTQADIDSFQTGYSGCTALKGNVMIHGDEIDNLDGLDVITSVGGNLDIYFNPLLTSISGLDHLNRVEGDFHIEYNPSVINLTGFDSLNYVGGNLFVGYNDNLATLTAFNNLDSIGKSLGVVHNNNLSSISGLASLRYIGRWLDFDNNIILTSLPGLENLDVDSLKGLSIYHNNSLCACDVESVCAYLARPGSSCQIYDNGAGCNSPEEVEAECNTGMDEKERMETKLLVFPNPTSGFVVISTETDPADGVLTLYDQTGRNIMSLPVETGETMLDIHHLSPGLYFVRLSNDKTVEIAKFVKE